MAFKRFTILLARIALAALVVAAAAWAGVVGWNAFRLKQAAGEGQALLEGGLGNVSPQQAKKLVDEVAYRTRNLRAGLAPVAWAGKGLAWLPGIGKPLAQLDPLMAYASELANAGEQAANGIYPLWEEGGGESQAPLNERLYAVLEKGQPVFASAEQSMQRAKTARAGLDASALPESLQGYVAKADAALPNLEAGISLLKAAPALLGGQEGRSYLVMAQNRDELRATGGFITALGTVQVRGGKLVKLEIGDSYAVDDFSKGYPLPPEPMQRFMLAGYWVPRDGNWSPDYPASARTVQGLYELSTGVKTSGAIAFDQSMVRSLLQVTGPIKLETFPEAVTADNVETTMHQAWAPAPEEGFSQEWWLKRKDFIPQLGQAMMARLLATSDAAKLAELGRTVMEGIRSGHLSIYLNDAEAEAALASIGLDSALRPGAGDYLQLVDSNIGFNKADAVVKRYIEYHAGLSDPQNPTGLVILDYTNPVKQDVACVHKAYYELTYTQMQERCYWDYWRVYTAGGSRLGNYGFTNVPGEWLLSQKAWKGPFEVYDGDGGTSVFAGLMVLPTHGWQRTIMDYKLPGKVITPIPGGFRYRLRVQKQAGLESLRLILTVSAPENAVLVTSQAGWDWDAGQKTWNWQGTIRETTDFTLDFQVQAK